MPSLTWYVARVQVCCTAPYLQVTSDHAAHDLMTCIDISRQPCTLEPTSFKQDRMRSQTQLAFPDLAKAQSAVQRVFGVLDRKSKIDPSAEGENNQCGLALHGEP